MKSFVAWVESRRIRCALGVLAALLLAADAQAALPYTFASGAAARAAEVNANFVYLADRSVPVGAVIAFAGTTPPPGWLLCDGSAVDRALYAELFAVIGSAHGEGDQITTFNLPDYRGRFLRGTDGGAGRDPDASSRTSMATGGAAGDAVGSVQDGALATHGHGVSDPGHTHTLGGDSTGGWNWGNAQTSDRHSGDLSTTRAFTGITVQSTGGSETRPTNASVSYIIKY